MVQFKFNNAEDMVVWGKLLAVLGELNILPQNPAAWDYGPHRLYQVAILTWDDEPFEFLVDQFCTNLDSLNTVGAIKPQFYGIESYPAEFPNQHRYYLTLYI